MALRTDYKDDILDLTQNTQRKYRMITNADGTVSFEDVTAYSQVGDSFGAAELNEIANSVNEGGSNMYYDPETDIKYLKNQDGEWVEVGKGGLLGTYLIENGALTSETASVGAGAFSWYAGGGGFAAPTIIGESSGQYIMTYTGSSGYKRGTAYITNPKDLTNASVIKIDCSATTDLASNIADEGVIQMFVSTVKPSAGFTRDAYKILLEKNVGSINGVYELNVSGLSGSYYIGFCFWSKTTNLTYLNIRNLLYL